jgi:hypothetical protein
MKLTALHPETSIARGQFRATPAQLLDSLGCLFQPVPRSRARPPPPAIPIIHRDFPTSGTTCPTASCLVFLLGIAVA